MDAGLPPDGVRLTRREVFRRVLALGGGVLATSALGYGVSARVVIPTVAGPEVALPSTPTGTPTPPAVPSPTAAPPAELRLSLVASRLAIPRIGLDAAVDVATVVRGADGRAEIVVPDHGIVTPNRALGRNSVNNVWLLGHSRWRGVPQALHQLGALNVGDPVVIDAVEQARGREFPALEYRVTRCVLTDREAGSRVIYGQRTRPRLVIQTSVREAGVRDWILDRGLLESKVERVMDGVPDDPAKYLLLVVIAELTDGDADRAARIAAAPVPTT